MFRLHGERLTGRWALVRFHGRQDPKRENWLLIKEKDELAEHGRLVTESATTSVASHRDIDAIAAAPEAVWEGHSNKLPAFSAPALATLVDALPEGPDWLFEVKFDGYRALTAASGDRVRNYTRNGNDWTGRYRAIARAIAALNLDRALLDGEVVAIDQAGRTDFGALQRPCPKGTAGHFFCLRPAGTRRKGPARGTLTAEPATAQARRACRGPGRSPTPTMSPVTGVKCIARCATRRSRA